MRRSNKFGRLFVLLIAGLITPVLLFGSAQAASANSAYIVAATGATFGIAPGAPVANKQAEQALGSTLRSGSGFSAQAHCLEPGYVQVFDSTGNGGHIHTSFPGLTISPQTFAVLLHRGITYPGSRAIWMYRWDNNSAGFDYYTSFSNENCFMAEQNNPLSAQAFPVNNLVTVSVCFVSWETGAVLCGQVGFVNRIS